jgi:hypothetical protein
MSVLGSKEGKGGRGRWRLGFAFSLGLFKFSRRPSFFVALIKISEAVVKYRIPLRLLMVYNFKVFGH